MHAYSELPLSFLCSVPLGSALLRQLTFYSTMREGQCFFGCRLDVWARLSRYAFESKDTCLNPTPVSCFFFFLLCEKKMKDTCKYGMDW